MGTNLDPGITDPKRRYKADACKGVHHRDGRYPESSRRFLKNAGKLFGESPNLRRKK